MRAAFAGLALLLACGGAEEPTPVLEFDTQSTCDGGSSCISAGAELFEVDGVRVLHKRLPGHPLVAMLVQFDGEATSGKQVWSEALAFGLFQRSGSNRFSASQWDAQLLHLGASLRAFDGTDYSTIAALAPLPRWRDVWDLLAAGLWDPNTNDYDLGFARAGALRAYASERDEAENASALDAWARLFAGQPRALARESQAALATVSTGDLSNAWRGLFVASRLLITVVGDVARADVEDQVRALSVPVFPRFASGFAPDASPPPLRQSEIVILPYPDTPTWYIDSYFKGPSAQSPDYPALSLGLEVLDARLFQEVRDARGLAYSTGAAPAFYRESYGHIWLGTRSPREALPVVQQLLAELRTVGPEASELDAAREGIRTRLLSRSDDPWDLAFTLSDWQLTAGRHEAIEEYLDALQHAQPENVAAALNAYLREVKTAAAGGGDGTLSITDLNTVFVSP
jgi:zinc protease